MSINATLIVQMIVFAAFVWFTMKFVWPPLAKAIQERQERISEGLASAERSQRELAQAQERSDEALREAREQAQQIIAQANQRGNDLVEEAKQKAIEKGDSLIAAAQAEIQQERNAAREDLRKQVSALAVAGASKILNKELDAQTHSGLLDELAAQL